MNEPEKNIENQDNKSKLKSKKWIVALGLLFGVCFSLFWLSGKGAQFFKIFTYSVKHSNTVDDLSGNF